MQEEAREKGSSAWRRARRDEEREKLRYRSARGFKNDRVDSVSASRGSKFEEWKLTRNLPREDAAEITKMRELYRQYGEQESAAWPSELRNYVEQEGDFWLLAKTAPSDA